MYTSWADSKYKRHYWDTDYRKTSTSQQQAGKSVRCSKAGNSKRVHQETAHSKCRHSSNRSSNTMTYTACNRRRSMAFGTRKWPSSGLTWCSSRRFDTGSYRPRTSWRVCRRSFLCNPRCKSMCRLLVVLLRICRGRCMGLTSRHLLVCRSVCLSNRPDIYMFAL